MFPNELPKNAAYPDLVLGGKLLTGDGGVFIGLLHLMFLKSHLHKLIAEVDEGDALGMIATVHHHVDPDSELLIAVEELHWIGVVFHIQLCF